MERLALPPRGAALERASRGGSMGTAWVGPTTNVRAPRRRRRRRPPAPPPRTTPAARSAHGLRRAGPSGCSPAGPPCATSPAAPQSARSPPSAGATRRAAGGRGKGLRRWGPRAAPSPPGAAARPPPAAAARPPPAAARGRACSRVSAPSAPGYTPSTGMASVVRAQGAGTAVAAMAGGWWLPRYQPSAPASAPAARGARARACLPCARPPAGAPSCPPPPRRPRPPPPRARTRRGHRGDIAVLRRPRRAARGQHLPEQRPPVGGQQRLRARVGHQEQVPPALGGRAGGGGGARGEGWARAAAAAGRHAHPVRHAQSLTARGPRGWWPGSADGARAVGGPPRVLQSHPPLLQPARGRAARGVAHADDSDARHARGEVEREAPRRGRAPVVAHRGRGGRARASLRPGAARRGSNLPGIDMCARLEAHAPKPTRGGGAPLQRPQWLPRRGGARCWPANGMRPQCSPFAWGCREAHHYYSKSKRLWQCCEGVGRANAVGWCGRRECASAAPRSFQRYGAQAVAVGAMAAMRLQGGAGARAGTWRSACRGEQGRARARAHMTAQAKTV